MLEVSRQMLYLNDHRRKICKPDSEMPAYAGSKFSKRNLEQMRQFCLCWPIAQSVSAQTTQEQILQTASGKYSRKQICQTVLGEYKLPCTFYETEALRAGWSVRQLGRQISSQFYERTALSRNKAAMLRKAASTLPEDIIAPQQDIKVATVFVGSNLFGQEPV